MVYRTDKEIQENKKAGDRVFGVRKDTYKDLPASAWVLTGPLEGILHTDYYSHPSKGPDPLRYLTPEYAKDLQGNEGKKEHPWDSDYWLLEDWVICDTKEEAEAELKKLAQVEIEKLENELYIMHEFMRSKYNDGKRGNGMSGRKFQSYA